ncbi:MAG: flagellar protein FlaG [Pseudomonadota bacterium]
MQSRDARDRVMESLPRLEEHFQMARRNLRFHEDEASGRVVIAVVDADTGEIIRRIPPEQAVRMAENLQRLDGLLADEWA